MGVSAARAYLEIGPSSDAEDLFLQLEPRFEGLAKPRSAVEARIADVELGNLMRWCQASKRWEPAYWCEDTRRLESANGASNQEMFGALFLIVAANCCREDASEISVWPALSKIFKDSGSYPVLFAAGQPTDACKKIIAAGSRRLGLRNLIDRYGKEEYFETIKLQFGFTHRGAVRRLGEWLNGCAPLPVRILSGEISDYSHLKSESFSELWRALRWFQKHPGSKDYTRTVIQDSAWIRAAWIDDLLEAAAEGRKTTTAVVTSASLSLVPAERDEERVCEPILRWERDSMPQLILRLNEERVSELSEACSAIEFQVDGKTTERWTKLESGGWRGGCELLTPMIRAKPNLRPKLLSIRGEDKIVEEIELREFGLGEPFIVYDLVNGALINEANRLDPNRDYALVCDADLSCPAASRTVRIRDGQAQRVDRGWGEDLKVFCDGAIYWEPRISEKRAAPMPLAMRLPEMVDINSDSPVFIEGMPADAVSGRLRLGSANYRLEKEGEVWRTDRSAKMTLTLAVSEERVRVRMEGDNYCRSVTPKLNLSLRGIARRNPSEDGEMEWEVVNLDHPLERADGIGQARVFSDEIDLFEGFCKIGRIGSRAIEMRDLHGWGAPLCPGGKEKLVESVEDHGAFRFIPNFFGRQTGQRLVWRSPRSPRKADRIIVWYDLRREPQCLDTRDVRCENEGAVWVLPPIGEPAAIAVAYDGMRLGSWLHTERVREALNADHSARVFAMLRWLKVPVLNKDWQKAMRVAVAKAPVEFIRGWLGREALPKSLVHRNAEDGIETVAREFLWNYSERNRGRVEKMAATFPVLQAPDRNESEVISFQRMLSRLGEVCPSLAYSLARTRMGNSFSKHIRGVAIDLISRPEPMEAAQLFRMSARYCADLARTTQEQIEHAVAAYADWLEGKTAPTAYENFYLRRLGETDSGRKYIAAALLFHLAEGRAL
ncbi:MAG: hypothetical protein ACRD22_08150 [Terriglobia bacterium]